MPPGNPSPGFPLCSSLVPARHPFQETIASFKLCYYGNGHDVKQSCCLDVLRGKGGWAPQFSLAQRGPRESSGAACIWFSSAGFHLETSVSILEGLELGETHRSGAWGGAEAAIGSGAWKPDPKPCMMMWHPYTL